MMTEISRRTFLGSATALALSGLDRSVLRAQTPQPLLLVNGKTSPDRFEKATSYLELGLDPWSFKKDERPRSEPIRTKVIGAAQFSSMSA